MEERPRGRTERDCVLGKVHYFKRTRHRATKRWAFVAFILAAGAVLAAPELGPSTPDLPNGFATDSTRVAGHAPYIPRAVALPAGVADLDCRDFGSQGEAQAFMEDAGTGDPHRLDGDDDGVACERLR